MTPNELSSRHQHHPLDMSFFPPTGPPSSSNQYGRVRPPTPSVWTRAQPLPVPSVTLTRPTPASSPPLTSPPEYATSSPPKYALIPQSNETALLLGPPPDFSEPSHCPRCIESSRTCRRCRLTSGNGDHLVRSLIFLNVLVWTLVIWGYVTEWNCETACYEPCFVDDLGTSTDCVGEPMMPSWAGTTWSFRTG